jgi:hypothetical protein
MPINKTISIPFCRSNYYTIVWRNSEEEDGKIRYMYLIFGRKRRRSEKQKTPFESKVRKIGTGALVSNCKNESAWFLLQPSMVSLDIQSPVILAARATKMRGTMACVDTCGMKTKQ